MKKVLFVLAAIAMVGCSNEEVLDLNQNEIAFGENFVENATRANYSDGNAVTEFAVYGNVTPEGGALATLFGGNGATVSGTGYDVAWSCTETEYWLPKAEYNFAAIVDGTAATLVNGLPGTINHTVATGDEDLLYATKAVTTTETADGGLVAFQFSHLLSKVQFTIVNGTTGYKYQVTSINVEGAAENGVYTVAGEAWAAGAAGTVDLTFGTTNAIAGGANEVASETHQILPLDQTLNITIAYNILDSSDNVVGTMTKTGSVSKAFAANTVYNITAELGGNTIKFAVDEVLGWKTPAEEVTLS